MSNTDTITVLEPWQREVLTLRDDASRLSDVFSSFCEHLAQTVPREPEPPWQASCTCNVCRRIRAQSVIAGRFDVFVAAVRQAVGETVVECAVCVEPAWQDDSHQDHHEDWVCDPCRSDIPSCEACTEWSSEGDGWLVYVGDYGYCQSCLDASFSWCEDCDEYYRNDDASEHRHGECDWPLSVPLQFVVPANSHGTITQDERLRVELPEGLISEEAIEAVVYMLWREQFSGIAYSKLERAVDSLEKTWQAKQGNFTRRLSSVLHKEFKAKLDPGLLSRVGSTIREHATSTNVWHVEFTRDLNQPAEAFYHATSCWWGSEGHSRCALKRWGGLGMRSYDTEGQDRDRPTGRAWVQPLDRDLRPTIETLNAHAYLVYNGYGELSGYTPARLVAYLASRTYRKVPVGIRWQYVNNGTGYLVADQATCDATSNVAIRMNDQHQEVAA
jgi:hypothetical protein